MPELFIACGTEDFLYQENQLFKSHLEKLEIPFEYRENNMEFELEEFARLIRCGEYVNCHSKYSAWEMEVLDTVRRGNGVVFPADGK